MNIKNTDLIEDFVLHSNHKAVDNINIAEKKIKYSGSIIQNRKIEIIGGEEELVRAIVTTKLVNEYKYELKDIEFERTYEIGRPKVNTPRIDLIVKDASGDPFLYIELKSPEEYENNQDEIIEKQLFNLAAQEKGSGRKIKYLVLMSCDLETPNFPLKSIVIDYQKVASFSSWKEERNYVNDIPIKYGIATNTPYGKGAAGRKLETNYSKEAIASLRTNLHNVLWGGGGTDDNEIFTSLVNLILAKIQDESSKKDGEIYDFQNLSYVVDGVEQHESREALFERINKLYRSALKNRMYITNEELINRSYVVNTEKFSLGKLKYAVSALEKFSFIDGRNSLNGIDILGDFFEGIIRNGFKQSKGQFFTHTNIVKFILWGLQTDKLAIDKVNNEQQLPYVMDPSAGSSTFLIEYMRFITTNIKYRFSEKLYNSNDIQERLVDWFGVDTSRENRWAREYIYGIETNFNLGTASKVNMIMHGDGASNIFVRDGLLPFECYKKRSGSNVLDHAHPNNLYEGLDTNEKFDIVISNPPFSVSIETDTLPTLEGKYLFGKKKSENLFIERYYQLLKEKGRMGIVLPESLFDTKENKYIRLFIYKYFNIKAIVSLPQSTFAPYTPTKTSILFAQKKTAKEVEEWNELWGTFAKEYGALKTRVDNLIKVYVKGHPINRMTSIRNLSKEEHIQILAGFLSPLNIDFTLSQDINEIIKQHYSDIEELLTIDKGLPNGFGRVNAHWVFAKVAAKLQSNITMAYADNVGYKRTKRGELPQLNDLYRQNANGEILVDDGVNEKILDFIRLINWN